MDIWVPGYTRVSLGEHGGVYDETSHPKGCVHTTEGGSLAGAETAYRNYPPHMGYDPRTRQRHQYVPLNKHSYAFRGDESDDEYVIQIEFVGFASQTQSWSDQMLENIAWDVFRPLEVLIGIPRRSLQFFGEDAGFTLASVSSPIRLSPGSLRNYKGWLGHQHIPNPDVHWDPGKFPIQKVFNFRKAQESDNQPIVSDEAEKDLTMIDFLRGDSKVVAPEGTPYGYRVFRVDYQNNTSEWVRNDTDTPVLMAEYRLWQKAGNVAKIVDQATLDAYNKALTDAATIEMANDQPDRRRK